MTPKPEDVSFYARMLSLRDQTENVTEFVRELIASDQLAELKRLCSESLLFFCAGSSVPDVFEQLAKTCDLELVTVALQQWPHFLEETDVLGAASRSGDPAVVRQVLILILQQLEASEARSVLDAAMQSPAKVSAQFHSLIQAAKFFAEEDVAVRDLKSALESEVVVQGIVAGAVKHPADVDVLLSGQVPGRQKAHQL